MKVQHYLIVRNQFSRLKHSIMHFFQQCFWEVHLWELEYSQSKLKLHIYFDRLFNYFFLHFLFNLFQLTQFLINRFQFVQHLGVWYKRNVYSCLKDLKSFYVTIKKLTTVVLRRIYFLTWRVVARANDSSIVQHFDWIWSKQLISDYVHFKVLDWKEGMENELNKSLIYFYQICYVKLFI